MVSMCVRAAGKCNDLDEKKIHTTPVLLPCFFWFRHRTWRPLKMKGCGSSTWGGPADATPSAWRW